MKPMSEKKREEKHRITVYIDDNAYRGLQTHIASTYSTMNTYGAISNAVNYAVTSCYPTPTLSTIKKEEQ